MIRLERGRSYPEEAPPATAKDLPREIPGHDNQIVEKTDEFKELILQGFSECGAREVIALRSYASEGTLDMELGTDMQTAFGDKFCETAESNTASLQTQVEAVSTRRAPVQATAALAGASTG